MSPIRSRRRAGRRTEKSPSRAELSAASSASRLSIVAPVPSIEPCPFVAAAGGGAWAAAVFVPLVWRLVAVRFAGARLVVDDLVVAVFAAGFFFAVGFRVVDLAVAPVLAGLLLPPLVRGWATAPLLLHESQRSSERYSPCKAGDAGPTTCRTGKAEPRPVLR